jgi:ParB-like chromosome segregation protein Spo0J
MKEVINLKGFPVKDIKANPLNPRFIRDKKFEDLKRSIQDLPQMLSLREIVVDEDCIVLGGNMRLKALKDLKFKTTDVVMWKGLSDIEKKEFVIKDNANYGNWDWDILANSFDETDLKRFGLNVWQPQEAIEEYNDYEFENNDEEEHIVEANSELFKKRAVMVVEFNILDYPVAFDLIKTLTEKGADIGALLIEKLISEDGNI